MMSYGLWFMTFDPVIIYILSGKKPDVKKNKSVQIILVIQYFFLYKKDVI